MGGLSERADHVGQLIARLKGAYLAGGDAHLLHHKRDRAPLCISIGYRERDTFAPLAATHYHKMARTARAGYLRRFHYEFHHIFGEMLLFEYSEHRQ